MYNSDFLFAHPSFLEGMARVLDLGGVLDTYNYSLDDASADFRALSADWNSVGSDLWIAVDTIRPTLKVPMSRVGV